MGLNKVFIMALLASQVCAEGTIPVAYISSGGKMGYGSCTDGLNCPGAQTNGGTLMFYIALLSGIGLIGLFAYGVSSGIKKTLGGRCGGLIKS